MNRLNQKWDFIRSTCPLHISKLDSIFFVTYDSPLVGKSLKVGTLINGHKTCENNVTVLKLTSTNPKWRVDFRRRKIGNGQYI